MIYLTVNDTPSGVYKSQVTDVLHQINLNTSQPVKLIAFISIRNYKKNKITIQNWYSNATVIPMIPGIKNWFRNKYILKILSPFSRSETCIARNVMAYAVAASHFKNVVYDGRGAIGAELEEYPDMIPIPSIVEELKTWEKKAVLESDFRIAVSNALVDFWKVNFNYNGNDHLVIPCTVNRVIKSTKNTSEVLAELEWQESDVILIYSGGVAGWQSFDKLTSILKNWISEKNIKVLFLTKSTPQIESLIETFPNAVKRRWVRPEEVSDYTAIGDYGMLIREENNTNRVASPVKFAEYLNAGLNVIISNHIGDFSEFVQSKQCGHLLEELINQNSPLIKTETKTKQKNKELAETYFSKSAFNSSYKQILTLGK